MKFNLATVAFAILVPAISFAQGKEKGLLKQADEAVAGQGYGAAGCGLGSMVIGNTKDFTQVFAATTNGTSGSQTFGISSGTSNCEKARSVASKENAKDFATANRQELEVDIARAQGESLDSLTALLGCNSSAKVGQVLQSNLASLQVASDSEMANRVVDVISNDAALSTSCTL